MAKVRKPQISPLIAGKGWITVKATHEAGDKGLKMGLGATLLIPMDTSQGKRKELSPSAERPNTPQEEKCFRDARAQALHLKAPCMSWAQGVCVRD